MSTTVGAESQPGSAAPRTVNAWRRDRWFFTGTAVAALLTVFAGFARTFYLKGVFDAPPLSGLLRFHGVLFSAWIVLFLVQTSLVAARRTDVHRRLGVAGGVLAAVMFFAGMAVAIDAVHRGAPNLPGLPPPLVFFIVPFGDMVLFAGLVGAALHYRRKPDTHKRLMLLATISILAAAIARIPGIVGTGPLVFFGLTDVFIVAGWAYDRWTRGRIHPAFLWGGLVVIGSQAFRLWFGGTQTWQAFAAWFTGLF